MTAPETLRYRKSTPENMTSPQEPAETNSTPLHIRVRETIRRQVKAGELIDKAGRLMTEAELGKHFGVSRITIRNAIKPLVDEGMFERERGRGTFLRTNQPENWVGRLMGFSETIKDAGYRPGAKILLQGMTNKHDAEVRKQLRERAIWQLKRVRLADDIPIAIEHAFYPPDIGLELEKRDLTSIVMYRVFEAEIGFDRPSPSAPRSRTPPPPSFWASRPAVHCCQSSDSPSTRTDDRWNCCARFICRSTFASASI